MSKSIFPQILRESTEKEVELLIEQGADEIRNFRNILVKYVSDILQESDIGNLLNNELKESVNKLASIVVSLRKTVKNLDTHTIKLNRLKAYIVITNEQRKVSLKVLFMIDKDPECDDLDKETAHRYVTQYDQLVTEYDSLIYKVALKHLDVRKARAEGKLTLHKFSNNISNSFDDLLQKLS